jgi:hypothetical protein
MQQNYVSRTTRFDDEIHIETDEAAIRVVDIRLREAIFPSIGGADDAEPDAVVKLRNLALHDTLQLVGSDRLSGRVRTLP